MSKIEQISQRSKESILKQIKNAYKDTNFIYQKSIDPLEHIKLDDKSELEHMIDKMTNNKFIVEQSSQDKLEETINKISSSYNFKSMIYGTNLDLDLNKIQAETKTCFNKPVEELRHEVFNSDFSVINAEFGISSHGVVLVLSSKAQPRLLSLAPKLCIILLKKENILKSLAQALNLVKEKNEILPSNILFIAGPSRTADIELITVFGVHGPCSVHVVLY